MNQMLHIIGGMKDLTKLGKLLGAVAHRIHELGGPKPSQVLREAADYLEKEGK